jgi:hypothetical protein
MLRLFYKPLFLLISFVLFCAWFSSEPRQTDPYLFQGRTKPPGEKEERAMNTEATTPALESFETTTKLTKTQKIKIAGAFSRTWNQGQYGHDRSKAADARWEHQRICRDLARQGIAEPQMEAVYFRALPL